MTKIKLCGLSRPCDIEAANKLKPEYIGFVFAPKRRRYIDKEKSVALRSQLDPAIRTVGVFVKESPETVAAYLNSGIIDIAQLHGGESTDYIRQLRDFTDKRLIQAFRMESEQDIEAANTSCADYILLDSGPGGMGTVFDWQLLYRICRPYFLAGGLTIHNIGTAISTFHPYAVDVSSGIETNGLKDIHKMNAFVSAIRTADKCVRNEHQSKI